VTQKTILLIDDDADLLQVVGQRCRQIGLRVLGARNLLTATAAIENLRPDVICVDVQMPTGNGLQFCEMLVSNPRLAGLPIIVLTGQRDGDTLTMCRRLQLEYVVKNTDVWRTLEPLIKKLMAQTPKPRALAVADAPPESSPTQRIPLLPDDIKIARPRHSGGKQIIVADDDTELVRALSQRLSSLGCSVIAANSALEAINAIHRVTPDLVCLDVNMPSGNGLSVCEMMASDERLRAVPVIILTGCSDQTTIRRCHDLLVFYVQKGANIWSRVEPLVRELLHLDPPGQLQPAAPAAKPQPRDCDHAVDHRIESATRRKDDGLMDAVFAMLGSEDGEKLTEAKDANKSVAHGQDTGPPWVLCIDDDKDYSDSIKVRLEQYGVAVARAYDGLAGYRMAFTHPASAILLDYNMPNGQGDYILDRLKRSPVTKDIPVIIITGVKDKVLERRMLAMGAAGFFHKPLKFEELRQHLANYMDILAPPTNTILIASRN
jgi:CheY-like chemotaxis protein